MKIYCEKCSTLMGEVVNGSRLRKGFVVLCRKCFGADQAKIAASEFAQGASTGSIGLDFMNMFGMKK